MNPIVSPTVFVPCGGRPESIDISNFHMLLNEDGTPRIKYIVEGANLFLTQASNQKLTTFSSYRKLAWDWKMLDVSSSKMPVPTREA